MGKSISATVFTVNGATGIWSSAERRLIFVPQSYYSGNGTGVVVGDTCIIGSVTSMSLAQTSFAVGNMFSFELNIDSGAQTLYGAYNCETGEIIFGNANTNSAYQGVVSATALSCPIIV
jgi:hypothetical protein